MSEVDLELGSGGRAPDSIKPNQTPPERFGAVIDGWR